MTKLFYILLVGMGGFLGSVTRYLLAGWVQKGHSLNFPLGTLAVNAVGCFLIGFLVNIPQLKHPHEGMWLFVVVGVLGGFTTFSAFSYETVSLFKGGFPLTAFINIGLQVVLCLSVCWLGYFLSRSIP